MRGGHSSALWFNPFNSKGLSVNDQTPMFFCSRWFVRLPFNFAKEGCRPPGPLPPSQIPPKSADRQFGVIYSPMLRPEFYFAATTTPCGTLFWTAPDCVSFGSSLYGSDGVSPRLWWSREGHVVCVCCSLPAGLYSKFYLRV